jgi:hypothetical protein
MLMNSCFSLVLIQISCLYERILLLFQDQLLFFLIDGKLEIF